MYLHSLPLNIMLIYANLFKMVPKKICTAVLPVIMDYEVVHTRLSNSMLRFVNFTTATMYLTSFIC